MGNVKGTKLPLGVFTCGVTEGTERTEEETDQGGDREEQRELKLERREAVMKYMWGKEGAHIRKMV